MNTLRLWSSKISRNCRTLSHDPRTRRPPSHPRRSVRVKSLLNWNFRLFILNNCPKADLQKSRSRFQKVIYPSLSLFEKALKGSEKRKRTHSSSKERENAFMSKLQTLRNICSHNASQKFVLSIKSGNLELDFFFFSFFLDVFTRQDEMKLSSGVMFV